MDAAAKLAGCGKTIYKGIEAGSMKQKIKKISIVVMAVYIACACLLSWIAGDAFRYRQETTTSVAPAGVVGDMVAGFSLTQRFEVQNERIDSIALRFADYGRQNTGTLRLIIQDALGETAAESEIDVSQVRDNQFYTVPFAGTISGAGWYTLTLTAVDGSTDNFVSVYYGNAIQTARASMAQSYKEEDKLVVNGGKVDGILCMEISTTETLRFMDYYWPLILLLGLALLSFFVSAYYRAAKGKTCLAVRAITMAEKYQFLMKQLVGRDFKTKYKRSVFGVFWSFLNPLLTMLVQYVVFSTLFKNDIPNFPAYLLTGIVLFNFFNESSSLGLTSITGNATLITKVYVPKIIYPLSRVLSSSVNFLLALIPLFVVFLCTGERLHKAALLLPFPILCLLLFCIGVSLILSTLMVFFRDMQFLWGVLTMIWMYATPIFYPESIIPMRFMQLYKMNPLYHFIRFMRIILIEGISPEPKAYLLCIAAAVIPLLVGIFIFRKQEHKFVLNL
ncbi:ABC transporter permease [Butyricicoccus faecihominis]|uniref:ABC transporter permease n=1 Tax=Butyricicoccus faecihominis TaxID=1712515 RepID=UPI002479F940|nr:ABC transporter permease [Butyricicoccus faecihominis]MCQ5131143.1 ABC transporter permease [Butyricicoccus faecihominis]